MLRCVLPLLIAGSAMNLSAAPLRDEQVPAALKPWIGWSLQGIDERDCPLVSGSSDQRRCAWPSTLQLELGKDGGRFELQARLYAATWIALPGGEAHWPQEVRVDGAAAPVVLHDGQPALWLTAGAHRILGELRWGQLPESLYVPESAGLLSLSIDGAARPGNGIAPGRDDRGHVWLGRNAVASEAGDRHLSLKVFRLIDDGIPARLTTHIDIEAAGEVRDEIIGPVLPEGFIPLSLGGSLPARLDEQGRLHVQVRPGLWNVELVARAPAPLKELASPKNPQPWPEQEVWSLLAHEDLRVVEAGGAPAIDPRQTQMPESWRDYPAFLLQADAQLALDEKQRGDPQGGSDQLSLQRQLWLDFDGRGYTVQDQLSGRLNSRWRLEATAPLTPGRVQVDGEPQFITRLGEAAAGVEVRHGLLNLVADSRIDGPERSLPVAGWNSDLQSIETTLNLPPGWRLFATSGTDGLPDTWIGRWSLLDLFVVLVASVAAFRLFGLGWGLATLLALALTWHEPGAPRWAWLNLIAAIALVRALPDALKSGQLPAWLQRYRWVSAIVIVLIALPFAVQQVRSAVYPQLEQAPFVGGSDFGIQNQAQQYETAEMVSAPAGMDAMAPPPAPAAAPRELRRLKSYDDVSASAGSASVSQQSIQRMDPEVLTQTGPGLPNWNWRAVTLSWSGPVTADQRFRLWLSPPWLTRLLQVLGVGLIFVVLAGWMQLRRPSPLSGSPSSGTSAAGIAALALTVLLLRGAPASAQEAELVEPIAEPQAPITQPQAPKADLIAELRSRLLAPPDCAPDCAQIARLSIEAGTDAQLSLRLSIDALATSAVPLPLPLLANGVQGRVWQPSQVLIDGQPAPLLRDASGALVLGVNAGHHEALVRGSLAGFDTLQLPLPLKPRLVSSTLQGWLISGLGEQGQVADALQLLRNRSENETSAANAEAAQALPPLFIVARTLHLGLDWDVETQVHRIGVTHTPVFTEIPLLPGEQVTGDVRIANAAVQLSLGPGQTEASWTSRLPIATTLQLQASKRSDTVEIWQFDVSPLWHAEFEGLPPISHQSGDFWLPRYQPWPGESLSLRIARPGGASGQTLTLDGVQLQARPAQRATDYTLSFQLRASQGGQHALALPEGLSLQSLSIDGQTRPARQENSKLILPLHPGSQNLSLDLRSAEGIAARLRTPALALGLPGVNARIEVQMPADRWILALGGPALGPAVLFWGLLAVLVVVAYGLARLKLTPLRFWHWLLLMLGLSQLPVFGAALVAGWLLALGLRDRLIAHAGDSKLRFNAIQAGLALLTLIGLGLLCTAVAYGLLGAPEMQITGNGSYGTSLQWYQDRWSDALPTAWVISLPLWVYRVLMLLWALWLANALLGWLHWGWGQFTEGGVWRKAATRVAIPTEPDQSPHP